jgi:hypothetical protein
MKPAGAESWIVGALALIGILAVHWLAFRVGRRRPHRRGAGSEDLFGGTGISSDPIEPK